MTRKDYIKIARAISNTPDGYAWRLEEQKDAVTIALRGLTYELADILAEDNPRFDRAIFIEACGL